jgi:hypothetical protein
MKGMTSTALLAAVLATGCGDQTTTPRGLTATGSPDFASAAAPNRTRHGFGFNGTASGFATARVFLSGGGSYDAATASNVVPTETVVHSGGGFSCISGVTIGPLAGCADGEGVRWDTAQLLASTSFRCSPTDALKPAATGANTVVLLADFYRAGDGNDESFTGMMIVSTTDIAPNIPGVQNFWIQGVGCGTAIVNFSQ